MNRVFRQVHKNFSTSPVQRLLAPWTGDGIAVTLSELDVMVPLGPDPAHAFVRKRLDALTYWKTAKALQLKESVVEFMPDIGVARPGSDTLARITTFMLNTRSLQARIFLKSQLLTVRLDIYR
jgi:hypothetical protein